MENFALNSKLLDMTSVVKSVVMKSRESLNLKINEIKKNDNVYNNIIMIEVINLLEEKIDVLESTYLFIDKNRSEMFDEIFEFENQMSDFVKQKSKFEKEKKDFEELKKNVVMPQLFLNGISVEQLAEVLAPMIKMEQKIVQQELPEDDLLTRDQACAILSINKTTLWKHTRSGKLKSFGIGNRVFYSKKQILEAVNKNQQ